MDGSVKRKRDLNPGQNANILSRITFFFAFSIFKRGLKDFKEADVYEVINSFSSKTLGNKLENAFELEKKRKNPSFFKAIWKVFGMGYIIWGLASMCVESAMMVIKPLLIGKVVAYFSPRQTKITRGDAMMYAWLMVGCIFFRILFEQTYNFAIRQIALRVKIACSAVIFRKVLKQNASITTKSACGQAVTLITKDTMVFDPLMFTTHHMLVGIVQIFVMTYMMYVQIGVSAFVGVGVILLFIPFQAFLGSRTTRYRYATCQKTDERIRLTQELLSAIRVIKMYTWESFFCQSIDAVRRKEMQTNRILSYIRSICVSLGLLTGRIALYASVITFIALGNHITAEKAFVVVGCFSALRSVLATFIPVSFLKVGELRSTLRRMNDYLLFDESIETTSVRLVPYRQPSVVLKNVKVVYKNHTALQNINATLEPGITLLTGAIGSGKSTFIRAILGDTQVTGTIEVSGNLSYASQDPWLFPGTIRQNIIFNEPFDKGRYDNVVRMCALKRDFELFSLGDATLLTDKGLNLSKGQKARINLARAIYKDADIYLLDDCLSSVDMQAGKYIFQECIKKFLKYKVCLLVSHQHRYLSDVNDILILSKGDLKYHGLYANLRTSNLEMLFDKYDIPTDVVDAVTEDADERVCNEMEDDAEETSKLLIDGNCKSSRNIYEEFNEKGAVGRNVYYKYFSAGGIKLQCFIIVLAIAAQGTESLSDYFVRFWVDSEQKLSNIKFEYTTNSTEYKSSQESHDSIMNQYSIVIFSLLVLTLTKSFLFFFFSCRASIRIHRQLLDNIVNAVMVFFDKNLAGNIINRLSRDFSVVDEQLPFAIFQCIKVTLMLLAILTMVSTINPWFLLPSGLFGFVLYFGCRLFLVSGRSIRRIEGSTRSPVIGHMQATFDGLTTIRASRATNIIKDEFDDHQDVYNSTQYMHLAIMQAFSFCFDVLSGLYVTLIIFTFLIFDKNTGAGKVGLAITQSFVLTGLLQWCVRQWSDLEIHMTSTERVMEYMKAESENKYGAKIEDWLKKGKIIYKDVSLRYSKEGELVLNNISFTVNPREKVGIVGRTGAGKSSIISTLFRLYAFEGTITVDDVDINTLRIDELRSNISIIPQDPILFSGTIRTNLDPYNQYSDNDLWTALDEVEMRGEIESLDQAISENGSNFSTGQMQLICLARAILQNNLILVLDEATANVDTLTDSLIQTTIRRVFADRTIIIIAHRLHTIMDCDKVLVMDAGNVVEYDHPKSLLNSEEGIFYGMVKEAGMLPSYNQ